MLFQLKFLYSDFYFAHSSSYCFPSLFEFLFNRPDFDRRYFQSWRNRRRNATCASHNQDTTEMVSIATSCIPFKLLKSASVDETASFKVK